MTRRMAMLMLAAAYVLLVGSTLLVVSTVQSAQKSQKATSCAVLDVALKADLEIIVYAKGATENRVSDAALLRLIRSVTDQYERVCGGQ